MGLADSRYVVRLDNGQQLIRKFVLSSTHLNPFFGGHSHEKEWRDAVLDLLEFVPNVIVLSESRRESGILMYGKSTFVLRNIDGFTSSQLRKKVLEITSPSLSSPVYPVWWPFSAPLPPNLSQAREEPVSTWTKVDDRVVEEIEMIKVDQVLRHIPSTGGTQWTSLEVDSTSDRPRCHVVFWKEGKEAGRLEVVGASKANIRAVGSVAESLGSVRINIYFYRHALTYLIAIAPIRSDVKKVVLISMDDHGLLSISIIILSLLTDVANRHISTEKGGKNSCGTGSVALTPR